MATGVRKQETMADWDVSTFTTAPPEELPDATDEELSALFAARPEEVVEEVDFGVESDAVSALGYADESHKLYIGKEFTPEQFLDWFAVQKIGSLPYTGYGIHHTAIPDRKTWTGLQHLHNTFSYYNTQLGWPRGMGPHLWLRSKRAGKATGPRVYVGTHPAHDGIGISYRNSRYLHAEFIDRFTYYAMDKDDLDLYHLVNDAVCKRIRMPLKHVSGRGVDGASSVQQGYLFHRRALTDIKDCPGEMVKETAFDAAMQSRKSGTTPTPKPTPKPGDGLTRLHLAEDYAKGRQVGAFSTESGIKSFEQMFAGAGLKTYRGKA